MVESEWGAYPRYCYVDCDFDAHEVYCWDTNDWLLYGFTYAMNGDAVVIDFESKKRKKYAIVDFDEGEQASPIAQVFSLMEQKILDGAQWEEKYQTASDTIATMEKELGELRQFKADTESADAQAARDEVFSKFDDLVGVEAFENLRENCAEYDVETLEEKCYAIRGRNGSVAKFSLEEKTPKLKVNKTDISNEPYGGIFAEYGIEN
jgi:FtsZ-binding cell division protein ZapB